MVSHEWFVIVVVIIILVVLFLLNEIETSFIRFDFGIIGVRVRTTQLLVDIE